MLSGRISSEMDETGAVSLFIVILSHLNILVLHVFKFDFNFHDQLTIHKYVTHDTMSVPFRFSLIEMQ